MTVSINSESMNRILDDIFRAIVLKEQAKDGADAMIYQAMGRGCSYLLIGKALRTLCYARKEHCIA